MQNLFQKHYNITKANVFINGRRDYLTITLGLYIGHHFRKVYWQNITLHIRPGSEINCYLIIMYNCNLYIYIYFLIFIIEIL